MIYLIVGAAAVAGVALGAVILIAAIELSDGRTEFGW